VPLAPLSDARLVPSSIAQSLGLQDAGDRPLFERLVSHLRERRALLLLDNFEQLLDAAPLVAALLQQTRDLHLLVTSRSPLRVSGEQEFEIPPLALPDLAFSSSPDAIAGCEAVRLFVERATAVLPSFTLDEHNATTVALIARRLDGLPLAVELAAARIKLLPPDAMLPRLERSLGLLVGGARELPDRQQTLRSTIEWSYGLLGPAAKRLLEICSVFRGGIPLDVLEAMALVIDPGLPLLDALQELVDHSLLRRQEDARWPRFSILLTIREFAAERLKESNDSQLVQEQHADGYMHLAEEADRDITGPKEKEWLDRLGVEHDNIRAAIEWYRRQAPTKALQLAVATSMFWQVRGHFTEGRDRLCLLLDEAPEENATRVRALYTAGYLAIDQGDLADATRMLEESVRLAQRLRDTQGQGRALLYLGRSKIVVGHRAAEALPDVEAALALLRRAGDAPWTAWAAMFLGLIANFTGRLAEACAFFEDCVGQCQDLGFRSLYGRASTLLGITRIDVGDLAGARRALDEGIAAALELGDRWVVSICLGGFAGHAAKTGRPRMALRLAGAAEGYAKDNEYSIPAPMRERTEKWIAPVRASLGAAAVALIEEGRGLRVEEALAYARANAPEEAWRSGPSRNLTRREHEVATLVAEGLKNRDIARRLFLSVRTVDAHVDHILTKLGFDSRSQLVAWAYEQKLLPKIGTE
jgi:predicted ATPase/DNA-binding CsgD family transcriptional regulator